MDFYIKINNLRDSWKTQPSLNALTFDPIENLNNKSLSEMISERLCYLLTACINSDFSSAIPIFAGPEDV